MEESTGDNNDSPIEQVRLTVPVTDDPTLPVITFRTWVLGPVACALSAITLQYFSYRQNSMLIPSQCLNLLTLTFGKLMAAHFPTQAVRFPGTKWVFSMNPGPFNVKEHVLISIFASSGSDVPLGMSVFILSKIFYKKNANLWLAMLLSFTTQMSGYGFAGIYMHFLVNSPLMWWPLCLVDVSLFRALHEVEVRPKGHLTNLQFFSLVAISSFAYYVVPNYFFPSIGYLSVVCWVWKDSVFAQQIGSGRFGFGLGSIALDWNSISGMFGNPLAAPLFAVVNIMVGFILFQYIVTPISYWSDSYNAKRFPFSSYELFDFDGQVYNIPRVMSERNFTLDQTEYEKYSKIYMSTVTTYTFGFTFAAFAATLTNFVLFNGRDAWCQLKQAFKGGKDPSDDVHSRLMKKYQCIPHWWFYTILFTTIGSSLLTSKVFGTQLQLPYWIVLLGYFMALIVILPVGVLQATTGQSLSLGLISEMIVGYVCPGKPLANMAFKAYGDSIITHALTFLSDFKLGHYMKIPPKSMFLIQVFGTIFSSSIHFITAWWIISTTDNICDVKKLPVGSPWTCPDLHGYFNINVIWGLIGPSRFFAPHGVYSAIYYFFAVGAITSMLSRMLLYRFPEIKWIRLLSVPVIFLGASGMPTIGPVNYWSGLVVALLFNLVVYRKYKGWWAKYNYVLSCGLDFGVAFMALLTSFTLQPFDIYGVKWWGLELGDHCPLAQCPTAPGVQVPGCPVYLHT